ncbi:MAG: hypothetical protein JJT81_07280 [Rubellimicrobium sp.]|nr:hypothetical protein [Rubellimicrobium sp.]
MSPDDQKGLVLAILLDFLENESPASIASYISHVGFDMGAIRSAADLSAAWLAHYRLDPGTYDVTRATGDLATWPPIAARIAELRSDAELSPDDL